MKCRINAESKNEKVVRTKNERIILFSKCEACNNKISKFIKEQETSGLLNSLEVKTSLTYILLVGPLSF